MNSENEILHFAQDDINRDTNLNIPSADFIPKEGFLRQPFSWFPSAGLGYGSGWLLSGPYYLRHDTLFLPVIDRFHPTEH
jgi:hypothetical protein